MYRLHFACNASDIEAILGGQKWKLLIGSHKEHLSCGTLIEMFKSPYVLCFWSAFISIGFLRGLWWSLNMKKNDLCLKMSDSEIFFIRLAQYMVIVSGFRPPWAQPLDSWCLLVVLTVLNFGSGLLRIFWMVLYCQCTLFVNFIWLEPPCQTLILVFSNTSHCKCRTPAWIPCMVSPNTNRSVISSFFLLISY